MQLAQEILDKLQDTEQLPSAEIDELFFQIRNSLQTCTQNDLELPYDFLLQRILAYALRTSSTRAVKLFQVALKRVSLQKTTDLFAALAKAAPSIDNSGLVDLNGISATGVKLVPVGYPSFAPDVLGYYKPNATLQRLKADEYEMQQRKPTTYVRFQASEWEMKRKNALYDYLRYRDGCGFYRALVSSNVTQTIQNFFGFAQLEAEGRVHIRNVCAQEAAQLDGNFTPQERELRRIFVTDLSREFLQARRGFVFSVAVTEPYCCEWARLHGKGDFTYNY